MAQKFFEVDLQILFTFENRSVYCLNNANVRQLTESIQQMLTSPRWSFSMLHGAWNRFNIG